MTNVALQALIDLYGNQIFMINFDGSKKLFIGIDPGTNAGKKTMQIAKEYEQVLTWDDISLETVGGTDFVVIHRKHCATWDGINVPYKHYMVSATIWTVAVTDEYGDYLPDLNKFF